MPSGLSRNPAGTHATLPNACGAKTVPPCPGKMAASSTSRSLTSTKKTLRHEYLERHHHRCAAVQPFSPRGTATACKRRGVNQAQLDAFPDTVVTPSCGDGHPGRG